MKVYISGKITGLPIEEAKQNFKNAADYLKSEGYEPVNPMELNGHDAILKNENLTDWFKWCAHMKIDICALMDCDMIYLLPDWRESQGARIEHDIALKVGISAFYDKTQQSPTNE